MAVEKWVTIRAQRCELSGLMMELRERRAYPSSGLLRAQSTDYVVRGYACTAAIRCNMTGVPCRWAFNNPDNDPF